MSISYEQALRIMKQARREQDKYATGHSRRRVMRAPEREKLGALLVEYLSEVGEPVDGKNDEHLSGVSFRISTVAGPLEVHYNVGWGAIFQRFTDESKYGLLGHGLANTFSRSSGKWNFHASPSNDASSAFLEWKTEVEKLTSPVNPPSMELEPEIERHFTAYRDTGSTREAMALVLLGDETYVRRTRMPKWNVEVDMLREPKVAVRYNTSWGIPTSKSAHRQRAEYFDNIAFTLSQAWHDLVRRASNTYGEHGSLVSGVYRDHFPGEVKDRLRFLAHGQTMVADAVRLHTYLANTRSPLFS